MDILQGDYRTIQQAASELGIPYFTLNSYVIRRGIPTKKLANIRLVKLSDLASYVPRKDRQAVSR